MKQETIGKSYVDMYKKHEISIAPGLIADVQPLCDVKFIMQKHSDTGEWIEVATSNNREMLWNYMQEQKAKYPNEKYRIIEVDMEVTLRWE